VKEKKKRQGTERGETEERKEADKEDARGEREERK
jgi:hypothetical protein